MKKNPEKTHDHLKKQLTTFSLTLINNEDKIMRLLKKTILLPLALLAATPSFASVTGSPHTQAVNLGLVYTFG